jgi:hypothetical protein
MRLPFFLTLAMVLAVWFAPAARAESFAVEVGKSKLVRLPDNQQPAVVFVGNPQIADVVIERSGVVFVLGREPGETDMWILDDHGNALMHRPLIVTPLASRQVSVFRGRAEQTLSCTPRCSTVPTPIGDERGAPTSGSAALLANAPTPTKAPTTEELIESLRQLIPEIGKVPDGGTGGSAGQRSQ